MVSQLSDSLKSVKQEVLSAIMNNHQNDNDQIFFQRSQAIELLKVAILAKMKINDTLDFNKISQSKLVPKMDSFYQNFAA